MGDWKGKRQSRFSTPSGASWLYDIDKWRPTWGTFLTSLHADNHGKGGSGQSGVKTVRSKCRLLCHPELQTDGCDAVTKFYHWNQAADDEVMMSNSSSSGISEHKDLESRPRPTMHSDVNQVKCKRY